MMNSDETKADQPTPEQLLKMLDQQIAARKGRKKNTPARRAIVLAVGIFLILGGMLGALLLCQYMAQDLRRPQKNPAAAPTK
jgi:hypothetical protein